ncbi:hypothetical protein [Carboxylicivirga linearis]|uniref:Uncharacterized protein n=1 Tax=Carboxylicivirga linearis TaxID=1628157 RepID=A0ABS5JPW6_9BACT|nr:hypothetical protein [Carboxylicivirga linearis]MBS2096918.1 hypothetical protein [Carboxylicivirga linearis]
MNVFVFIGLLLVSFSEEDSIRMQYHHVNSKESLETFISIIEKSDLPVSEVYLASAYMQMAKYVFSPYSKLKYFNKGKDMLEVFISKNPNNIDGKYVRYLVQSNAPSFLGYSSDMVSDKIFIRENINEADIGVSLKKMMLDNLSNE